MGQGPARKNHAKGSRDSKGPLQDQEEVNVVEVKIKRDKIKTAGWDQIKEGL